VPRDRDIEILVPESFGEEVTPRKRVRKSWDEDSLFAVLEQGRSAGGFAAVRELWDFCNDRGAQFTFGSGHGASGTINLPIDGQSEPLFTIYGYTNGPSTLAINFEYLAAHGISRARLERIATYARLLNGADQKLDGLEAAEFRKRPGLSIDTIVATPRAVDRLKRLVDDALAPLDAGSKPLGSG
jgi:phytoene dehydrogenase-like protein